MFGVAIELAAFGRFLVPGWLGLAPPQPYPAAVMLALLGGRYLGGAVIDAATGAVLFSMLCLGLFLVLRMALRRTWLAGTAFVAVLSMGYLDAGDHLFLEAAFAAAIGATLLFLLVRYGLVATVACQFLGALLESFPLTLDFSSWYAGISLFCLAVIAALFGYAFFIALGGRPVFREGILKD